MKKSQKKEPNEAHPRVRVMFATTIHPTTLDAIRDLSRKNGLSQGQLIESALMRGYKVDLPASRDGRRLRHHPEEAAPKPRRRSRPRSAPPPPPAPPGRWITDTKG